MHSIKGHFDGQVVILDEPAPVDSAVEVVVNFPEEAKVKEPQALIAKQMQQAAVRFGWDKTRQIKDGYAGSVADECIRQRREVDAASERVFHWGERAPDDTFEGSFADEVIRQRRMD